jgi:alpha-2-macroglobulin family protein/Big-like domain-containing protein
VGFRSRLLALRSWKARVAVVLGGAIIGAAAGGFVFLHPGKSSAVKDKPAAPKVGAQTVAKKTHAAFLTVVATSPVAGSEGAAVNTAITMSFNLPVDPASLQSYFSVLPNVPGTFAQGSTAEDVVFAPSKSFPAGSTVNAVLRKDLLSRDAFAMEQDYSFKFLTQVSSRRVLFEAAGQAARLVNIQSGHSVSITMRAGDQVPSAITLQTFRAGSSDLLGASVYSKGQYVDAAIGTASMKLVSTKTPVKSGDTITVSQPDGVYVLLATDAHAQYGALWLDFSRFGVLLRQDDQKIVVAGQDLTTGDTTTNFQITFYGLQDSVKAVRTGTFSGTAEFPVPYPPGIDVAVASAGGQEVVIPISAPQTEADIKVVESLAQKPQIYLTTDRAAYRKGDTVKFAGVLLRSNDQLYTLPSSTTVGIWPVMPDPNQKPLAKASVGSDGTFAGSFPMPGSAFTADGSTGSLRLYADPFPAQRGFMFPSFADIQALGSQSPSSNLAVSFDKTAYLASDTIVASIAGADNKGLPLANQSISLAVYSANHKVQPAEVDSFPAPSIWGVAVRENVQLRLDASGRARYSFNANLADRTTNQEVTLAVTGPSSFGARTAIVNQADAEIFFMPSRSIYQSGDQVVAPFVAENRRGARIANLTVAYEFDKAQYQGSTTTTTVVASGTLTTNADGLGTVRAAYSGPLGQVTLRVRSKDESGNAFEDAKQLNVTNDPAALVSFGAADTLSQLSVATDKIAYRVGDTAQLVITSPATQSVLLSLERGRIHQYRWVPLSRGDNPLALNISRDLAPGFTLMFSYFGSGGYITEGLPISINNQDRLLRISISADRQSYVAGQTAHLRIAVSDHAGAPVVARLIVDGYDASMSAYKLVDRVPIAGVFLTPDARATNASSSRLGIGGWGGRCGGGNGEQPAVTSPGRLVIWSTDLQTDTSGHASVDVPITQSSVRIALIGSRSTSAWGQAEANLAVQ